MYTSVLNYVDKRYVCTIFNNDDAVLSFCCVDKVVLADRSKITLFSDPKTIFSLVIKSDEQQRLRFQIELEFIQCLANPNYLNFLAQRNYLKDKAFISYLKYLQYWKRPEYTKYIKYPMCLHFLELLQYEHFRREIASTHCAKFIDDQQILHWQHYTRKRTRFLQPQPEAAATAAAVVAGVPTAPALPPPAVQPPQKST